MLVDPRQRRSPCGSSPPARRSSTGSGGTRTRGGACTPRSTSTATRRRSSSSSRSTRSTGSISATSAGARRAALGRAGPGRERLRRGAPRASCWPRTGNAPPRRRRVHAATSTARRTRRPRRSPRSCSRSGTSRGRRRSWTSYEAALEHSRRGLELSRATGQDWLVVPLLLAPVFALEMQGRVDRGARGRRRRRRRRPARRQPRTTSRGRCGSTGSTLWYGGEVAGRPRRSGGEPRARGRGRAQRVVGVRARLGVRDRLGARRATWSRSRATGAALVRRASISPLVVPAERSIGWDIFADTALGFGDLDEAEADGRAARGATRRTSAARSRPCSPAAPAPRCSSPRATRRAPPPAAREAMDTRERRRASALEGPPRPAAARPLPSPRPTAPPPSASCAPPKLALDAGGAHTLRDRARRELRRLGHRVDTGPPPRPRRPRRPERPRAGGRRPRRRRPQQPRDRRRALPVRQDRRDPPPQRLRQARRLLPRRSRRGLCPRRVAGDVPGVTQRSRAYRELAASPPFPYRMRTRVAGPATPPARRPRTVTLARTRRGTPRTTVRVPLT